MVRAWRVSVEFGRDDHAPLTDEVIQRLTDVLGGERTVIDRRDSGAVLVGMTVDATGEWAARSAAERALREAADDVWAELGLPPFTIRFVHVVPEADR